MFFFQTLTPDSGNSYFDFGTHRKSLYYFTKKKISANELFYFLIQITNKKIAKSVGEGCTVFFQGKHWFIGGRYNPDGLAFLETHTDRWMLRIKSVCILCYPVKHLFFRVPPPGSSQSEKDNFKKGCTLHDAGFILPDNFRVS